MNLPFGIRLKAIDSPLGRGGDRSGFFLYFIYVLLPKSPLSRSEQSNHIGYNLQDYHFHGALFRNRVTFAIASHCWFFAPPM